MRARGIKLPLPNWTPVAKGTVAEARRFGAAALDLAYPPACACCEAELAAGTGLCDACRKAIVARSPVCPRCGATLPVHAAAPPCPRCRQLRFHFKSTSILGGYDGLLRSAVLRIKRPGDRALASALGELLAERAAADLSNARIDVVVPVPMHWTRRVWRGANSPETIAARIAARLGVPVSADLLVRRRRTAPQASLSPRKRKTNVRGAFRAAGHRDLPGARVLLVDDILTTGATLNEAARTLKQAGSGDVVVAVLARAAGLV